MVDIDILSCWNWLYGSLVIQMFHSFFFPASPFYSALNSAGSEKVVWKYSCYSDNLRDYLSISLEILAEKL